MKRILRIAFPLLALSFLISTTPAHASGFCIPILTCPATPTAPADAPEISGEMIATGVAIVASVAVMIRGRRKTSS